MEERPSLRKTVEQSASHNDNGLKSILRRSQTSGDYALGECMLGGRSECGKGGDRDVEAVWNEWAATCMQVGCSAA